MYTTSCSPLKSKVGSEKVVIETFRLMFDDSDLTPRGREAVRSIIAVDKYFPLLLPLYQGNISADAQGLPVMPDGRQKEWPEKLKFKIDTGRYRLS